MAWRTIIGTRYVREGSGGSERCLFVASNFPEMLLSLTPLFALSGGGVQMLGEEIGGSDDRAYERVYKGIDLENGGSVAIRQVSLDNIPQEDLDNITVRICFFICSVSDAVRSTDPSECYILQKGNDPIRTLCSFLALSCASIGLVSA